MEGQASIRDMIRFSWDQSKAILFPFRFKHWLKILIIVWLAASGVQGCGLNFQAPGNTQKIKTPSMRQAPSRVKFLPPESGKAAGTAAPSAVTAPALPQQPETSAVNAPVRENTAFPVTLVILVIGGVLAAVGFGVLFIWLSCRFNFVLLDVLVTRAVSVRESFRRHQEIGNSYFGWSLAFLGIGLGAIAITGLLMGILIWLAKGHLALSVPAAIVGGLLIVALLLAMIVIGLVAHDFVSPIMYREKISTKEAWHKFFRAGTSKVRKVVQYILAVMGLTIVASIVQTVVSLVAMLAGLIAGGVLLIPGILLVIVIPSLKVPLIVLGAGLGLALIVIVLAVIGMAMLPASIFLRMFALTYVMRLCPDCDLLNFKGRP